MGPIDSAIGPLLQTTFYSILEVFILCVAGYILARGGVLDKKTQKQLNKLNVSLFTPALLFSKVAFFLSPQKLWELWIIPIFFVLVTLVSMGSAFFLGWMFGLKRSQRSFAMAAAMFMNSNSLPIALMQSLVVTVPGLKWGTHDNKNAMVGRALTYLVLYSTLGMVLRWSYGVRLLAQADVETAEAIKPPNKSCCAPEEADDERTPLLARGGHAGYSGEPSTSTLVASEDPDSVFPNVGVQAHDYAEHQNGANLKNSNGTAEEHPNKIDISKLRPPPLMPRRRTTFYRSFPNSPNQSRVHSSAASIADGSGSESESGTVHYPEPEHTSPAAAAPLPLPAQQGPGSGPAAGGRIRHAWHVVRDFMTVPLWAALASLIVACVRPLQHALEAHVTPVKGALTQAGNCSIPLTLVVLGAYFCSDPGVEGEKRKGGLRRRVSEWVGRVRMLATRDGWQRLREEGNEEESRPGETRTVVIAIASRMLITPLLVMPLMALSAKFDWPKVFDDPVFVVSNVLLLSSPPALTLAQITQAASGDAFERLISRTIFWAYCIITPPATILYVVVGLMLSKI